MIVEPGWLTPLAQYTAPMILILQLCLLYKTLGGGSWTGGLVPGPGAGQEIRSQEAGDEFQAGRILCEKMGIFAANSSGENISYVNQRHGRTSLGNFQFKSPF